jgi:hypothetical protein
MFRANRRLGWNPDPRDSRDYSFEKLGLASPTFEQTRKSLRDCSGPMLDQGPTSSCVGNAIAGAIVTREILRTDSGKLPSRLFIYFNSRRYHGSTLIDAGTFIRTAVGGLRWFGAPDETVFPFSTSVLRVNKAPPWRAYNLGYGRREGSYYRIFETGENRVSAVKAAILEGLPVIFGTSVNRDFLLNNGSHIVEPPSPSDPRAGGHCMLITGFYYSSDGLLFEIKNSWGSDWRDGGFCYFTEDYIRLPQVRDLTVIEGWKRLQNE